MFPPESTLCTGFYRDIINVSHWEMVVMITITSLLTFTLGYLAYELFISKKNPRIVYFFTLGILSVVVIKTLMPLTGYYTEIPHYSQFDCTFNLLVYPGIYGPIFDSMFIYLRLLTLFILPLVLLMVLFKITLTSIQLIRSAVAY